MIFFFSLVLVGFISILASKYFTRKNLKELETPWRIRSVYFSAIVVEGKVKVGARDIKTGKLIDFYKEVGDKICNSISRNMVPGFYLCIYKKGEMTVCTYKGDDYVLKFL